MSGIIIVASLALLYLCAVVYAGIVVVGALFGLPRSIL